MSGRTNHMYTTSIWIYEYLIYSRRLDAWKIRRELVLVPQKHLLYTGNNNNKIRRVLLYAHLIKSQFGWQDQRCGVPQFATPTLRLVSPTYTIINTSYQKLPYSHIQCLDYAWNYDCCYTHYYCCQEVEHSVFLPHTAKTGLYYTWYTTTDSVSLNRAGRLRMWTSCQRGVICIEHLGGLFVPWTSGSVHSCTQ